MEQSKKDFIFGLFFQPLRIVSFLIILELFLPVEISWETAQWFFYGFGFLFVGSFFVESLFRLQIDISRNKYSLKKELFNIFKKLYPKYEQNFSLEFVSVAAFTLFSFSSESDLVFWWSLKILGITTAWQIFTEFHHAKLVPIFNKIRISEKTKILLFIPLAVFLVLFFMWIYIFTENNFQFQF